MPGVLKLKRETLRELDAGELEQAQAPDGEPRFNLGLSHGVPGVVGILAQDLARGIAGFQSRRPVEDGGQGEEWNDDPSLLTGASWIGLAHLAAATRVEPAWDIALLLGPPSAGSMA